MIWGIWKGTEKDIDCVNVVKLGQEVSQNGNDNDLKSTRPESFRISDEEPVGLFVFYQSSIKNDVNWIMNNGNNGNNGNNSYRYEIQEFQSKEEEEEGKNQARSTPL